MPLYDYQCKQCQKIREVRHGFTDVYAEACPDCGGTMARVFNAAGIVFKGSGFYITDSRKGGGGKDTSTAPAAPAAAAPAEQAAPAAAAPPAPAASDSKKSNAA